MNVEDFYMKEAYKEAKKAYSKDEVPVGAVIVLNNKIVAKAHNLKDSTGIVTNHAEILAIQRANKKINDWRLTGAVMFVTLEPCPMCASAIQQSRISKIVYAASSKSKNNFYITNLILTDSENNYVTKIVKNFNYEFQCQKILNDFFKKKR